VFLQINGFLKVFDIEIRCRGYGSEVANPFISWKYWNLHILQIWPQDQWNCFIIPFKVFKIPTRKNCSEILLSNFTHHPDLKPQKREPWYCSKVSPGFDHEAVDCYFIVSPKPLKELDCSDGTVRHSSIE